MGSAEWIDYEVIFTAWTNFVSYVIYILQLVLPLWRLGAVKCSMLELPGIIWLVYTYAPDLGVLWGDIRYSGLYT